MKLSNGRLNPGENMVKKEKKERMDAGDAVVERLLRKGISNT